MYHFHSVASCVLHSFRSVLTVCWMIIFEINTFAEVALDTYTHSISLQNCTLTMIRQRFSCIRFVFADIFKCDKTKYLRSSWNFLDALLPKYHQTSLLWTPCLIFYSFENLRSTLCYKCNFYRHTLTNSLWPTFEMQTSNTCVGTLVCEWISSFVALTCSKLIHAHSFQFFLFLVVDFSLFPFEFVRSLFIMFITTSFFMRSILFRCFNNSQRLFYIHANTHTHTMRTHIAYNFMASQFLC